MRQDPEAVTVGRSYPLLRLAYAQLPRDEPSVRGHRQEGTVNTPDVTPTQYGAGGIFLAVALTCLSKNVTGTDLLAYLVSAALLTAALVLADALIRNGRAGIVASEMRGVQSTLAAFDRGTTDDEDDA